MFCSQGYVRERRCVVLEHLLGVQGVTEIKATVFVDFCEPFLMDISQTYKIWYSITDPLIRRFFATFIRVVFPSVFYLGLSLNRMITWICVVKVQTGSRDLLLLYFVEIRRDGVDMFHEKMRMIESFERKMHRLQSGRCKTWRYTTEYLERDYRNHSWTSVIGVN